MALSIVIPVFNEEKYISETIATIQTLLAGKIEFEIIVVNNASMDGTAGLLRHMGGIKLINLPEKVTVAKARNLGVAESGNFLISFIDGDMVITEAWANEVVKLDASVMAEPLVVTGCKCQPARYPSWIEDVWFKNENYRNIKESYINSGNLLTTATVFNSINGFDRALITGEDVDFCVRAKKAGATLKVNNNFKIYHEGYPKTLMAFIRRERWHGVGDLFTLKHFLGSRVAIVSLLTSFLVLVSLLLLIGGSILFLLPLAMALFFIVTTAHYKFRVKGFRRWINIYILQAAYFLGRTLSLAIRHKI